MIDNKILNQFNQLLNDDLNELAQLEIEKKDILLRFSKADKNEQEKIKKEMDLSIKKYENLLNEVTLLNKIISKL